MSEDNGINVLSLFDGMSCGQIALQRAGIKVNQYFASEIKSCAIKVTMENFPNTVQLGDVTKICSKDLPKIDLLIGGSPCQDFSSANKIKAGLNGEKSKLFFEYVRLLNETSPTNFLLENVAMDKFSYSSISHILKTFPVDINSDLVSAQQRQRSYWTNIGDSYNDLFGMRHCSIPQPKDKKILLQDILENGFADGKKSRCLKTGDGSAIENVESVWNRYQTTGMMNIVFMSQDLDYKKGIRFLTQQEIEKLQTVPQGYTNCLTRNQALNVCGDGWTIDVITHILSFMK